MRGLCCYPMGTRMVASSCQKGAVWVCISRCSPAGGDWRRGRAGGRRLFVQNKGLASASLVFGREMVTVGPRGKEACTDGPRRLGCCARPSQRAEKVAG